MTYTPSSKDSSSLGSPDKPGESTKAPDITTSEYKYYGQVKSHVLKNGTKEKYQDGEGR